MEINKGFMEYLSENYPDSIILDNMDGAIIGIDTDAMSFIPMTNVLNALWKMMI